MAMMGIISLILFSLFSFAANQYYSLRSRNELDLLAAQMESSLRQVFSQAIDVQFSGGMIANGLNLDGTAGQVSGRISDAGLVGGDPTTARVTFDDLTAWPAPVSNWYTLALFSRETGNTLGAGPADHMSVARKTALFFRVPSGTARTSGVLFLDYGPLPGTGLTMSPDWSDDYFDRVTFLEITKHRHSIRDAVMSVDFRFKLRYYRQSPGSDLLSWCPVVPGSSPPVLPAVATCQTALAFDDVEHQFSITMRNNLVRSASDTNIQAAAGQFEERVLGGLYFFMPILPVNVR